jgi:hypothetical protein
MKDMLLLFNDKSKNETKVKTLLTNVINLLTKCNKVFHCLQGQDPPGESHEIEQDIKAAVDKHRALGLFVTHKVHIVEDHAAEQYSNLPFPLLYCIEEFVE